MTTFGGPAHRSLFIHLYMRAYPLKKKKGYTCLVKKKGLVKANPDRVETPKGEYGCVYLADFAVALAVRLVWLVDLGCRCAAIPPPQKNPAATARPLNR